MTKDTFNTTEKIGKALSDAYQEISKAGSPNWKSKIAIFSKNIANEYASSLDQMAFEAQNALNQLSQTEEKSNAIKAFLLSTNPSKYAAHFLTLSSFTHVTDGFKTFLSKLSSFPSQTIISNASPTGEYVESLLPLLSLPMKEAYSGLSEYAEAIQQFMNEMQEIADKSAFVKPLAMVASIGAAVLGGNAFGRVGGMAAARFVSMGVQKLVGGNSKESSLNKLIGAYKKFLIVFENVKPQLKQNAEFMAVTLFGSMILGVDKAVKHSNKYVKSFDLKQGFIQVKIDETFKNQMAKKYANAIEKASEELASKNYQSAAQISDYALLSLLSDPFLSIELLGKNGHSIVFDFLHLRVLSLANLAGLIDCSKLPDLSILKRLLSVPPTVGQSNIQLSPSAEALYWKAYVVLLSQGGALPELYYQLLSRFAAGILWHDEKLNTSVELPGSTKTNFLSMGICNIADVLVQIISSNTAGKPSKELVYIKNHSGRITRPLDIYKNSRSIRFSHFWKSSIGNTIRGQALKYIRFRILFVAALICTALISYQLLSSWIVSFNPKENLAIQTNQLLSPNPIDPEAALWHKARNSNLVNDYQAYLAQYPNGSYIVVAREKLAEAGVKDTTLAPIVEGERIGVTGDSEQKNADPHGIYHIQSRDVPPEYRQAFAFLEFIKHQEEPEAGYVAGNAPNWNIDKFMSFISTKGALFTNVNEPGKKIYSSDQIKKAITTRTGELFNRLDHLSHIYSIPYRQYSELKFSGTANGVQVFISDWYTLTFLEEEGNLRLVQCDYTMLQAD